MFFCKIAMNYELSRREFGKTIGGLAGLASAFYIAGCKKSKRLIVNFPKDPPVPEPEPEPEPEPQPEPPNVAPIISLTREFPNNGRVKYVIDGGDSDGRVEKIMTQYNADDFISFYGSQFETVHDIIQRDNKLDVIVFDDKGLSRTRKDFFVVATRDEAVGHIEALLTNANALFARKPTLTINLGQKKETYNIDFIVAPDRNDSSPFSIIRYVDIGEDIVLEMRNQKMLNNVTNDAQGFRNLYLYRLPLEEITPVVKEFITNNYRRKLD